MTINDKICPETPLRILLPVADIPDHATVSKRTGNKVYTLSRVVALHTAEGQAVLARGFFLFDDGLSINQVERTELLHWHTTAEDFVDILRSSWEENK